MYFFIFLRLVSVAALLSLVVITSGSSWVCSIAAFSPRVWVIPLCVRFFGLCIGLYVVETLTSVAFARNVLSVLFEQVGSWGHTHRPDSSLVRWVATAAALPVVKFSFSWAAQSLPHTSLVHWLVRDLDGFYM